MRGVDSEAMVTPARHQLGHRSRSGRLDAVVSLDGSIADDNDRVGPLFDWYGNGDVSWSFEGSDGECRTTQASADFMRAHYADVAVLVIGRRLFDQTDGRPRSCSRLAGIGKIDPAVAYKKLAALVAGAERASSAVRRSV